MKIAIFGMGYVGTVTAAGLAGRGHDVCGVEVDPTKIESLRAGQSPVVEPGLDDLIAQVVAEGRLTVTDDPAVALERADLSLLCVGTPSTAHGSTDLSHLRRAVQDIRAGMATATPPESGFHAVVVRSTVPPGTVEDLVSAAFAAVPAAGWTVGSAMCPEFLREGSSLKDFFNPPFVVVGSADARVADLVADAFSFIQAPVRQIGIREAEALKYSCNAFHATKVSFTNEMSRIFAAQGIDSRQVMELFCEDTTLNVSPAYLRPGFAFGGSCLPKDLRSLMHMARLQSLDVPLLEAAFRTNELVVREAVDRVIATGVRTVALLGLSFKMNTDDLRESPNVDLAERLLGKGFTVRIYDPIVNPERLIGANLRHVQARLPHLSRLLSSSPEEALRDCGVAVISTSDAATVAALTADPPEHVLDLSGRLGKQVERLAGYQGIGWAV